MSRISLCDTRTSKHLYFPLFDKRSFFSLSLPLPFALLSISLSGLLRGSTDLYGNDTLPVRRLPKEQDTLDLTPCNVRKDTTGSLDCYHTGDGIRANQQPIINALHIVLRRRHNQHARALALINPHWDDEILFQEAR